ncbi:MAG: GH3 auxin-responsive promoter family protein [Planctomycetota bacterium]|nr:GH3 auxin-responsive promoter family protein [Planctomycetota bacterium]
MSLIRTLLRPAAYVTSLRVSRQLGVFLRAHQRTREVQECLLRELIERHRQTDFGRDHGFDRIRTYEDFRSAVPIRSYEEMLPYMQRVLEGHTTAVLPPGESVRMFAMTSGTTGKPKYIPATSRFIATIRRGWNTWGLQALNDHPKAWLRRIVQISSPMNETYSPTGVPCGAISGLLAATQKRIVRGMYVVPGALSGIDDPVVKYYAILRCSIGRDVAIVITANPSSTIKLIETGQQHAERLIRDIADGTLQPPGDLGAHVRKALRLRANPSLARRLQASVERDGMLLPRHFWNLAFLGNWTGGTLKLYLRRVRELFGDVPIRDIGLLASEGRFTVPLVDGTPAGVAEILDSFLEFIPAQERQSASPPALRAHELEVGQEYFLVVSNWAGLWRYNLDDRVRVVDHVGQSPVLEFLSRGLHTANITGEKITEHQVVEAMRLASARSGAAVNRFTVQGVFDRTPHYELRLERLTDGQSELLARSLDEALSVLNIEYHSKRSSGRLGPIRPVLLRQEELEHEEVRKIRDRRGRSEQYKHQYLLTDVKTAES